MLATIELMLPVLAASSSDSDNGSFLWLLGPGSAVAFYSYVYLRYRNTDKRHAFERQTVTEVSALTGQDELVDRVSDVENSRIPGDNADTPLKRLGANSRLVED